jgi:antagonist of KipI
MELFQVIKSGLFTTVQDLGRFGFQRFGVPVSGAMDKYAFSCANLLVGNHVSDACLEITLFGPELKVLNETQIAVAGADFQITVNDDVVPMWQTLNVEKGDVIAFQGSVRSGCRGYLSVRGGIDVPLVLGSRSTYVRGGFGGCEGRALRMGDVIRTFEPHQLLKIERVMPRELIPSYDREFAVDVVLGPQEDMFTARGVEAFLSSVYTVTPESDRMGYRLDGSSIEQKNVEEPLTDALMQGSTQVPSNGKPIVLMADAQTSGGYPKIATVTTPGVSRLAQARPNDKVQFRKTSQTQAHAQYLEFYRNLKQLENRFIKKKF